MFNDSLDRIIKETLDNYLTENLINENVFDEASKKGSPILSKLAKKSNKKTETQKEHERAERRDGNNINSGDEDNIRSDVDGSNLINIAALARKVYPNHTPEGAQSQLRKKLKGLTNDNGSEYHLKEREADIITKEMDNF